MSKTERLIVELPAYLVAGLRHSVQSGSYASESAAIEALLQTWYGSEGTEEPPVELLRAFVAEGIADAEAGRLHDAEGVYGRLRERIKSAAANKAK
jgi:antitoxin ParD1/3/4